MSTETFARAAFALLKDLDLKVKRQSITEEEKARVRFLQENKGGPQTAKEPVIDEWLRRAMVSDVSLRLRLFHEWLKKTDIPAVPNFDEVSEQEETRGRKLKAFGSDSKTHTALKKLIKGWLEEAGTRQVEIYAYVGPYEFPEKVLATIPEAIPESDTDEERPPLDEAALEALRSDHERQQAKLRAELEKVRGLLGKAQEKREGDLEKAEERWKKEKELLQGKLTEASGSAKKLQEEVSAKSQPISQLKRDLEDSLRQIERLAKEGQEGRASAESAGKLRDEADSKRTLLESNLLGVHGELVEAKGQLADAYSKIEALETEVSYYHEARTWMLADSETLEELKENMEAELDIRSHFSKIFQIDLAKKGSFQHRALDLHEVWKKLAHEESEIVEEFFGIALQDTLKDGQSLRDAASRLYDLKDSLLAREMGALALNNICNRFLEKKKAPPTPAKA